MTPTPLPKPERRAKERGVVVPLARGPVPEGPRETQTSAATERALERRWLAASVASHILVLGALLFGLSAVPEPPPVPVLKITLVTEGSGGAGASGGGSGSANATATQAAAAPAAQAPPQVQPQPPEPAPPPVPAPEPPKQVTEIPPPVPPPPAPVAANPVEPVPVAPTPEKPKPIHAKPELKPRPRREIVEAPLPVPDPMPQPAPAPTAPPAFTASAPSASPATSPAEASAAGTPGATAGPGKGLDGSGKGAIGDGAGPGDEYLERLYRHLLRFKTYPAEALSRKQQGSVVVGFTIAHDSILSAAHIEKSSGVSAIDQAAISLLNRASPAPPLPDSFHGSEARVQLPIDYKLGMLDQLF